MSSKYLNLKEWQKVSSGKDAKDASFQKALTALQKAETTATMAEVIKQAEALIKLHKADKALLTWLNNTVEAVKALAKTAEKANEKNTVAESENDADVVDLGALTDSKQLLKHLNSCRQNEERTIQFAYVEQADADHILAISPRLSSKALFANVSKATGSKKGAFGSLWVDGTSVVLQLDKPMSGLVKKLRKPIQSTGFKFKLIQLMDADGNVFESADDTPDAGVDTEMAPATVTAASGQASASRAASSLTDRIKRVLTNITAFANTLEAKGAKQMCVEAATQLKAGQADQAEAAVKKAEALLARAAAGKTASAPSTPTKPQSSKVAYTQTRLAWDSTRKHVQSELHKLEAAILKESANDEDFEEISAGVKQLYTVLDKLDTRLIDILDDALNAEEDDIRMAHQQDAIKVVEDYLSYVTGGDPFLEAIDDNGFVEMTFLSVLTQRLNAMKDQLNAAVA